MRDTFWRRARLYRVIDGDTVDLSVDNGRRQYDDDRFRLLGLNAPERRSATMDAWRAATIFAMNWFDTHRHSEPGVAANSWPLNVRTEKSDSFDRWLAEVECATCGASLNADLLSEGHAVPREGR